MKGLNVFLLTDEEYEALIRALDPDLWEDEAGLRAKLRHQHNAQKTPAHPLSTMSWSLEQFFEKEEGKEE